MASPRDVMFVGSVPLKPAARVFEALAKEHNNITLIFSENASHVLKFEPRPRSQLTPAEVMATYSADDVLLDPVSVEGITSWLQALNK